MATTTVQFMSADRLQVDHSVDAERGVVFVSVGTDALIGTRVIFSGVPDKLALLFYELAGELTKAEQDLANEASEPLPLEVRSA